MEKGQAQDRRTVLNVQHDAQQREFMKVSSHCLFAALPFLYKCAEFFYPTFAFTPPTAKGILCCIDVKRVIAIWTSRLPIVWTGASGSRGKTQLPCDFYNISFPFSCLL